MNKVALKVVYDKLDLNNDGTLNVTELKNCECVKTIIGHDPSEVSLFFLNPSFHFIFVCFLNPVCFESFFNEFDRLEITYFRTNGRPSSTSTTWITMERSTLTSFARSSTSSNVRHTKIGQYKQFF